MSKIYGIYFAAKLAIIRLFEDKSLILRREDKSLMKGSPSETCNPSPLKNTNVFNILLFFSVFEREL